MGRSGRFRPGFHYFSPESTGRRGREGRGAEGAGGWGRGGWRGVGGLQVVRGEVSVNVPVLSAGDVAVLEGKRWVRVVNTGVGDAEVLEFDQA